MSFAQINRLFESYKLTDNEWWKKFRHVAYEVWRKGAKNAPDIDVYMPIGTDGEKELTKDELNEIWTKYGKLDKKKKRVRLFRRKKRKNVRAKT